MKGIKENNDSHRGRNYRGLYEDSIGNLFRKNLSPSIRVVILMMLIAGIAYPLILTGIGQTILPFQSNGSVITSDGKNRSRLRINRPRIHFAKIFAY